MPRPRKADPDEEAQPAPTKQELMKAILDLPRELRYEIYQAIKKKYLEEDEKSGVD